MKCRCGGTRVQHRGANGKCTHCDGCKGFIVAPTRGREARAHEFRKPK